MATTEANPKRILLIDIGAPFGGVEAYILGLAEILASEAKLFAICGLPELAEGLRARGVRVFRIPFVGSRLSNLVRFLIATAVLPYLILRHRIDIVQVNGNLESMLVLPARLLGCFAIRTAHGTSEASLYRWYRHPLKFFPRFAAASFQRVASRVVCVSEVVGADVVSRIPQSRVVVIPNWVRKVQDPSPDSTLLGRPANLLYVGRLERYKGLHLLLEAIRGNIDARLTVVGVGAYRDQLEKLAKGLDVHFMGFCADTAPFYRGADIFINPSLGPEGLPVVSLESMSYGLPCIFSTLPVHVEISNGGDGALLFKSGSVTDLRAKLCALIEGAGLRRRISRNAHKIIQERYSPDAARSAYLSAFNLKKAS